MGKNINSDHLVITASTDSSDFLAGTLNSDVYNMSGWQDAFFVLNKTSGATGTVEARIHSAPDVTPTSTDGCAFYYRYNKASDTSSLMSAWTVATSSGIMVSAGAHEVWEFWLKAEDLHAGDEYIFFNSTEVTSSPVGGALTLILANPRYGKDIAPNVLA